MSFFAGLGIVAAALVAIVVVGTIVGIVIYAYSMWKSGDSP